MKTVEMVMEAMIKDGYTRFDNKAFRNKYDGINAVDEDYYSPKEILDLFRKLVKKHEG